MGNRLKAIVFSAIALAVVVGLASSVNVHGNIVDADSGFQVAGVAPLNHYLCGSGTAYLDSSTPCGVSSTLNDQFGTLSGCAFANDGGGLTCSAGTLTWTSAFADTSYTVGCWPMYSSAIVTGSSTQPVIDLNATISSASAISVSEGVAQGSSGGYLVASNYQLTIVCHGHHS